LERVDLLCPASVERIRFTEDQAIVEYADQGGNGQISGSLLVGADGAQSLVREALGIEVDRHDYRQTAVICNVTPEQDHRGRAFECFTPSGPFAVMPHVEGRCGLICCVEPDRAQQLLELPDAEFLEWARQRFGGHLGAFLKIGKRSSYPLRLVRAREDIRPRAVILGNAAHAIHPIGAQGFNLGLRDVAVLAEVLADATRRGAEADMGDLQTLRRYSDWRAPDQQGTIAYSDGLARLFSNPSGVAAAARTVGLLAHAFIPPLRRQLAVRAMGYRGRVPRLALGEPL
jgi:2-octaprenyl-6-methoxyphenol hydroxylase